ncbi:hypothetical protein BK809_0007547 [Diplodia seriata]|uniref:Uncharacterized protein n=1 Tax=Diplodia seriata TaxID=420778 RepID=A0A1S8BIZ3_9PEZI|nr:hypothetical protein BK809_0007547 [Diplodia seriata]
MYKKKGVKVHPVGNAGSDGSVPTYNPSWREEAIERGRAISAELPDGPFDHLIRKKFPPERIDALKIGDSLLPLEREFPLELLYNREEAIAWDFEHMGRIRSDVVPPQSSRTVSHEPWLPTSIRGGFTATPDTRRD